MARPQCDIPLVFNYGYLYYTQTILYIIFIENISKNEKKVLVFKFFGSKNELETTKNLVMENVAIETCGDQFHVVTKRW